MRPVFIYSPYYKVDIGEHVFPTQKYEMVYKKLKEEGIITSENLIFSPLPSREDLLLVHTPLYLKDLETLSLTPRTLFSELPLTREIVCAYKFSVGGTIVGAKEALEKGMAIHLGGGFHHAFPDHAEGFCYLNDVAISIRKLQKERLIKKALVVDCDLHQGNGTAFIFRKNLSCFTFSIHQENLYPPKEKSDLDIGLSDFTQDREYLEKLTQALEYINKVFPSPEIIYYLAGADPYQEDRLGSLRISKEGLKKRDEMVINYAAQRKIPLVILFAGGYAFRVEDTIEIHLNTCRIALKIFS